MENNLERGAEKIPTKQEVLDVIARYAEGVTVVRELSDEQGLYLLRTEVKGENSSGETVQYEYIRKGTHPDYNGTSVTEINRVDCKDGQVTWAENIEKFNEETGEWKKIE